MKTTHDIDTLIAEAERVRRSDPVRLRSLAEEIERASGEVGYAAGQGHGLLYYGMAYWRFAEYDNALVWYKRALSLFETLNDAIGVRRCLRQMGLVYQTLSRYDQAFECFWRELELWEKDGDLSGIAGTLTNIASTYLHISQHDLALEYYLKALALVEEQETTLGASIYGNIANLYMALEEYPSAMEYQIRALDIYRTIGDRVGESRMLLNIAWNYLQVQQYEKALNAGLRALEQFEVLQDKGQKCAALLHIGQVYFRLGRTEKALECLEQSIALAREVGEQRVSADVLRTMGDIYRTAGEHDRAGAYYRQALQIAADIGNRQWEYELHELLAEVAEQMQDQGEALYHYRQFIAIRDKVQNERRQKFMDEIQIRFNVEKAEKEKEIYRLKNIELADALARVESLNRHLGEINNEKNELLGIVAHDLKNPISGLSMSLSLLSNYLPRMSQEEIVRQIGMMNKTVQRMETIVSKLLDVNIIDSGTLVFQAAAFDLNEAVCTVMDDYGDRMREKQIAARFELAEQEISAYADRSAVLEVLDNLISNAVKYSPRDTVITVRTAVHDTRARFEVQDTGPGVDTADQDKLFKKFVRLGARPTGGESSTGLGLSIVKKLVDAMGGRVWCESEPGKGALFVVELPAAEQA